MRLTVEDAAGGFAVCDGSTHLGSLIIKRRPALNIGGLARLGAVGLALGVIGSGVRLRYGLGLSSVGLVGATAKCSRACNYYKQCAHEAPQNRDSSD